MPCSILISNQWLLRLVVDVAASDCQRTVWQDTFAAGAQLSVVVGRSGSNIIQIQILSGIKCTLLYNFVYWNCKNCSYKKHFLSLCVMYLTCHYYAICHYLVVDCRLYFSRPIATLNFTTRMVATIELVYRCLEEILSIISRRPNFTLLEPGNFLILMMMTTERWPLKAESMVLFPVCLVSW